MDIVAAELSFVRIPGPAARPAALIVLHDEAGRRAAGEAAPIPGFSRDTLDDASRALATVCALDEEGSSVFGGREERLASGSPRGRAVKGRPLLHVDEAAPPMEAIERALAPHAALLDAAPCARFALETALLDLLAQRSGRDVASCIRGSERALASVEISALLDGAAEGPPFLERALAALAPGFRTLKVKLRAADSVSLAHEIDGLATLRAAAPGAAIRLDPNGRWSVAEARRFLSELAPIEPAFVEQPVRAEDLLALGPCEVPWAADESLGIPTITDRLAPELGCAAFILKPAALGLGRARALAALARSRGLPIVVTHFMDGPIGLAAACEFALSLDTAPPACGLTPHAGIRRLPPAALPHHAHEAHRDRTAAPLLAEPPHVRPLTGPGLGVFDVVDILGLMEPA